MYFDIVHAWKDEEYRQTLNEEQLSTLPEHPAGELSEIEMTTVCGGAGEGLGSLVAAPSSATSSSSSSTVAHHLHSWSLLCDTNAFSASIVALTGGKGGVLSIASIGNSFHQLCGRCS